MTSLAARWFRNAGSWLSPSTLATFAVVATVHLHVLHHSLDPFGIVLAGLAIAAVIVLAGLVSARLIGKKTGAAPAEPGGSTDPNTLDA